MGESLWVR
jgi:hypothetical protein